MDHQRRFHQAAIERGIPETAIGAFAEFLRFGIWTSARPGGVPVGRSGGLPRLPAGTAWPSSEFGPLPFIVAIDCAALPRVDGLALPVQGSLLFFLHHEHAYEACSTTEEQEHARVIYVPAGVHTEVAVEPDHDDEMFCDPELAFVRPEHELFATVVAELPGRLEGLRPDLRQVTELRALAEELWPKLNSADVYLGGYTADIGALATDHLYDTPETRMAEKTRQGRSLEEETLRVMREWVPLAQFDPDDVHIGRFLIRHEDLAASRFDKALSFTAFTE
ncbi:YwqG family protein [Actinoplanes awajinensis]|uniref:DUF1963 domain-containing protein n=1 Tax=Actinoplanes awajinensis subsp. mycoplanecinus TaxID=135947 RepID=A0A117MNF8_9ACTN|nr:YwqG family protein [Actinoplanes awajinensis]KUL27056.1 hypothetical protein ADL15_36720 [Actinoplanes awajinensis subsp. mycoplanecinus]